jgi:hypothetical protein
MRMKNLRRLITLEKCLFVWLVLMILALLVQTVYPSQSLVQLIDDVRDAPYDVKDYKLHVFDCSNMSALMIDYLTEKGYSVKLIVVVAPKFSHAFVLVIIDGNDYYVESTSKRVFTVLTDSYLGDWWIYKNQYEFFKEYKTFDRWCQEWCYVK